MTHNDSDPLALGTAWSKSSARALAAVSLFCISSASVAADWEVRPRIATGAYVNDNYTLAPDTVDTVEVEGLQVNAELGLHASTQLTQFTLTPSIESTIFPDDEEWESDDYYLRLDWKHERQRFMAGLRADYSDETTVKSELPSSQDDGGLGEPDGGDAGIVAIDNNRQLVRVRPRASFVLTERSTLLVDAAYRDAEFDQESATGLSGYRDLSGTLGFAFAHSPTTTWSVRAIASNYERKTDSVETDSLGVSFDWTSRLSDTTQWYMRVGAKEVDVPSDLQGATGSSSETGFEGGIGADWTYKVTRLFVDATASVEPNSSGRIIQRDQIRLRLERQFSPYTIGWIGARYQRDTALSEAVSSFRDRDFATGTLGLEWRMSRDFSLLGQYDFRWQEFEGEPTNATGNAFLLSVVYEWRRAE